MIESDFIRVHRGTFSVRSNYSHLPHGYEKKKTTVPFHKLFFFPFPNANTAAAVERSTKLNAAFSDVFFGVFFFLLLSFLLCRGKSAAPPPEKADGQSILQQKIHGSHREGKICRVSPAPYDKT